jgi:hypothetical protein
MKRLSLFFISILVSYVFMAMPVYAQDFNYPFNDTMTTDFGPVKVDRSHYVIIQVRDLKLV